MSHISKHTCTYRGKLVRIELDSGEVIYEKFITRTGGKRILLQGRKPIQMCHVKKFECFGMLQKRKQELGY